MEVILTRLDSGAWLFRSIAPQPFKHSKPDEKEWVMLQKCSFCGLGFEPVWDVRLASCKHGYHEWCCRFHFENSTKCVEEGCDEEMHNGWWSAVGLVKPGTPARVFSTPRAIKKLPDSPLGVEFIGTPIKGQATQRVQSTSSLSSSPAATASGSTVVSVPQEGPFSSVLPHSTPSVEIELPAPISLEKPTLALSSKSNPMSTDVALVLGDLLEKKQMEPQGVGAKGTKGAGATRVHPKATVTSEENEEDEVDDEENEEEEEEEDQEEEEEEEEDGEGAEKVEGMEEGGRPEKGSHNKVAAKRKSAAANHRAGKRSKAIEGSKVRAGKSDGAPKHAHGVVNAGKRKKTPVVDRISKASNTRAGKAQSSK